MHGATHIEVVFAAQCQRQSNVLETRAHNSCRGFLHHFCLDCPTNLEKSTVSILADKSGAQSGQHSNFRDGPGMCSGNLTMYTNMCTGLRWVQAAFPTGAMWFAAEAHAAWMVSCSNVKLYAPSAENHTPEGGDNSSAAVRRCKEANWEELPAKVRNNTLQFL
jgi:hypothetical protein